MLKASKNAPRKPLPTDRSLTVKLTKVESVVSKFTDRSGNPKEQFRWVYQIVAPPDLAERELMHSTTTILLAPNGNGKINGLWKHLSAMLGHPIADGEEVDEQALIGQLFTVWMEIVPVDADGNQDGFQGIKSIQPHSEKAQPADGAETLQQKCTFDELMDLIDMWDALGTSDTKREKILQSTQYEPNAVIAAVKKEYDKLPPEKRQKPETI